MNQHTIPLFSAIGGGSSPKGVGYSEATFSLRLDRSTSLEDQVRSIVKKYGGVYVTAEDMAAKWNVPLRHDSEGRAFVSSEDMPKN